MSVLIDREPKRILDLHRGQMTFVEDILTESEGYVKIIHWTKYRKIKIRSWNILLPLTDFGRVKDVKHMLYGERLITHNVPKKVITMADEDHFMVVPEVLT